jgi:XTP/dITP diphosphohydrolase
LVIATHNPGKKRELVELMAPFHIDVIAAGDLGLPEPEETGTTFEANAELKALAATQAAQLPALADDSGVMVAALNGAPGIYTARWAGPNKDFRVGMERVNREIGANPDRSATFVSVLTLAWPDGHIETFRGEVEGTLVWPPRGTKGFGFDPMFAPEHGPLTFGEMEPAQKNALNHRARAFKKLVDACLR